MAKTLDERVGVLEEKADNVDKRLEGIEKFQQRMILMMLTIIAALAGVTTVFKGFGHTPAASQVAFYSSVFYFVLIALYLMYLALQRSTAFIVLFAAIIALVAAMLRIGDGFIEPGKFGNWAVSVCQVLASILCCVEGVRIWRKRT